MDETIYQKSGLGQHLERVRKTEVHWLRCQGQSFPLAARITIGRDKENMIHVDDNLVSRRHAVIQKIKEAYFVSDLESRNGTFVNEKRVAAGSYIKLSLGDVIRVGKTELKIT